MAVYDEICTIKHMYSCMPRVNSGFIHLKVGIQCVLFSAGADMGSPSEIFLKGYAKDVNHFLCGYAPSMQGH